MKSMFKPNESEIKHGQMPLSPKFNLRGGHEILVAIFLAVMDLLITVHQPDSLWFSHQPVIDLVPILYLWPAQTIATIAAAAKYATIIFFSPLSVDTFDIVYWYLLWDCP